EIEIETGRGRIFRRLIERDVGRRGGRLARTAQVEVEHRGAGRRRGGRRGPAARRSAVRPVAGVDRAAEGRRLLPLRSSALRQVLQLERGLLEGTRVFAM